jgi:exonuclease III
MNNASQRFWKILCWNVRGINTDEKWNPIRDTIIDVGCDVLCFQETKRQSFDSQFLRKFSPSGFDAFEFLPSIGASGGLVTAWKSSVFSGHLVFQNSYAITVKLTAKHNDDSWLLTNIYGPCTHDGKRSFIQWLKQYTVNDVDSWLIVGDFNLLRKPENRNRPGGDVTEMLMFNDAISSLGLIELPLYGRAYT